MRQGRWVGFVLLAAALFVGSGNGQQQDGPKSSDGPLIPPIVFQPGLDEARAETRPVKDKEPAAAPQATIISLEVVGPPTQPQGQAIDYEIVVRNTGAVSAASIRVEDTLAKGLRLIQSNPAAEAQGDRVAWSIGNLNAGAEFRIKVKVQPTDSDEFFAQPRVHFAVASGLRTRISRSPLIVTQSGPEAVQSGQPVAVEIRVSNNTADPLQHVVLRDKIPPGLQFMEGDVVEAEIGTLAANETRSVRLNAKAVQAGPAVNEVTARADGGITATCQATVLVQAPALVVRVDGPRAAMVGEAIPLRVEVANTGDQPVAGVGLLLTVPDGMEPLSPSTGGMVDPANRHLVSWALGTLASGERKAVSLSASARSAGEWAWQANARGQELAESKATAALRINAGPSLAVEVTGRDDAIDTGAETVYEVRVLNRGGVACSGVRLVAQMADGLEVVQAEGATAAVVQQQRVPFDPLPELPGRTEALYRLHLRGVKPGEWWMRIQVDADSLQNPLHRDVKLRVNATNGQAARTAPGPVNSGAPR